MVDSSHNFFDARDITFNEFENLAGQKGFPGADAVVLGNYEDDIPIEIDEDDPTPPAPAIPTQSELIEREYILARQAKYQTNPQVWGLPDNLSSNPETVYQPTFTLPASTLTPAASTPHNQTVEQGDEHIPQEVENPPNPPSPPHQELPTYTSKP